MFVQAEKGKGHSVIYHRNDGAKLIRRGGTPAWRNSNPGNMRSYEFAKENGSIGTADGFAIFPDFETGRRALARLLRGKKYRNLSVFDAVATYAPPEDKNDVANYRKILRQFTYLDLSRRFMSLTTKEFQIVLDAIQRIEGWKQGTEELIPSARITTVRKNNKGVIVAYQVEKILDSFPQLDRSPDKSQLPLVPSYSRGNGALLNLRTADRRT